MRLIFEYSGIYDSYIGQYHSSLKDISEYLLGIHSYYWDYDKILSLKFFRNEQMSIYIILNFVAKQYLEGGLPNCKNIFILLNGHSPLAFSLSLSLCRNNEKPCKCTHCSAPLADVVIRCKSSCQVFHYNGRSILRCQVISYSTR